MAQTIFAEGEYYHVFNRGVEKRNIFEDEKDRRRFFQSMNEFNCIEPIGSIYENSIRKRENGHDMSKTPKTKVVESESKPLVEFVSYCLNPNHFHFLLKQVHENGVSEFMRRLGNGYTKYFNHRHKRSGGLFQGVFKSKHVDSDEYLLHVSAYVNLNFRAHKKFFGHDMSKAMVWSSWNEYLSGQKKTFCKGKDVILDRFKKPKEYQEFAESSLEDILERKERENQVDDWKILLESDLVED